MSPEDPAPQNPTEPQPGEYPFVRQPDSAHPDAAHPDAAQPEPLAGAQHGQVQHGQVQHGYVQYGPHDPNEYLPHGAYYGHLAGGAGAAGPIGSQYVSQPGGPAPATAAGNRRRSGLGLGLLTAAAVVAGAVGTLAVEHATSSTTAGLGSAAVQQTPITGGTGNSTGSGTTTVPGQTLPGSGTGNYPGGSPGGGTGSGGTGSGGTGTGGTGSSVGASATAAQTKGVVTIVSVLKYQNAEAAGTGMVLTSNGEILTNNHVINGATSVTVTVVSTGKSYVASVVGTDPSDDVAVLQLTNAAGLQTAAVGDSSGAKTGDAVTGVGNAGGTGTLRAATGKITALDQSITASDDNGSNAEQLHGLIEVDAPIVSGDSGGPMYDVAGKIIGMDTAAQANGRITVNGASTASTAYAIPIDNALSIASKIEQGVQTTTIHIGLPGFIGVSVDPSSTTSATISSVLSGGPAANAGITAGSMITSVAGTRVTSPTSLKTVLSSHKPGSSVRISWTDPDGATHSANVTLATGPAD